MKKTVYLIVLILLLALNLIAQTYVVQVQTNDSRGWCYADIHGDIFIDTQYTTKFEFTEEGVAFVYSSFTNEYSLIDLNGNVINLENPDLFLKNTFGNVVTGFNSGLVPAGDLEKWGYLNSKGELGISLKYDYASEFNNGFAFVINEGKYIIIDTNGNETIVSAPNIDELRNFSEGYAPYFTKKGLFGFINSNGEVAIPAQFHGVGYFNAGLAWARTKKGKIGFINSKGEWVIEPQLKTAYDFDIESGLAKVEIKSKWCYINKVGEIVTDFNIKKFGSYSEGLARAEKKGKIGFINSDQNWIISPDFDSVRDFKNGYAAVKQKGGWGIINKSGEWIIEPNFKRIKDVVKVNN